MRNDIKVRISQFIQLVPICIEFELLIQAVPKAMLPFLLVIKNEFPFRKYIVSL